MVIQRKKGLKLKLFFFIVAMLSVSLFHFAIFWVYVNFDTVRLTFYRFDIISNGYVYNGLENYREIIQHTFIEHRTSDLNVFINTFRAIVVNLIILPIALFIKKFTEKKLSELSSICRL